MKSRLILFILPATLLFTQTDAKAFDFLSKVFAPGKSSCGSCDSCQKGLPCVHPTKPVVRTYSNFFRSKPIIYVSPPVCDPSDCDTKPKKHPKLKLPKIPVPSLSMFKHKKGCACDSCAVPLKCGCDSRQGCGCGVANAADLWGNQQRVANRPDARTLYPQQPAMPRVQEYPVAQGRSGFLPVEPRPQTGPEKLAPIVDLYENNSPQKSVPQSTPNGTPKPEPQLAPIVDEKVSPIAPILNQDQPAKLAPIVDLEE